MNLKTLLAQFTLNTLWTIAKTYDHLRSSGIVTSKRSVERLLHTDQFLPKALTSDSLCNENNQPCHQVILEAQLKEAQKKRKLILYAQLHQLPNKQLFICCNDNRTARYWTRIPSRLTQTSVQHALQVLVHELGKPIVLFPHHQLVALLRPLKPIQGIEWSLLSYSTANPEVAKPPKKTVANTTLPQSLRQLEAESIYILREAVANASTPVMLTSLGKDSSVMLHLARKAFAPGPLPFPLLHIDTRWKFQEMYGFRATLQKDPDIRLMTYTNPEAIEKNVNPFDFGSAVHTDITKTQALRQVLSLHQFDMVFGGARRDEEKSRAKERIFSFRNAKHAWDPKNQRPELWNLFNTHLHQGESLRVFPLSNWTELDVWHYIYHERIPVVPLYFSAIRPVVWRNGTWIMVDDERFRLEAGEKIEAKSVRFRTLGCYPLSGAIESTARTVEEILLELIASRHSERQGRLIDHDQAASMEKKKQEGYF